MRKNAPPPEQVTARIEAIEGGYRIELGTRAFSVIGDQSGGDLRERADFALYGLAILGMCHNLDIDFDATVSSDALAHVQAIGQVWEGLRLSDLFPLRLRASNSVPIKESPRTGGLICQSAGVDGTYSALRDKDSLGLTHGLFITGNDFLSVNSTGHDIRLDRTRQITELLDLKLVRAQTDIRRCGMHFLRFFPMILTMCLHFAGAGMEKGAFSSDLPPEDEDVIEKWSTNNNKIQAHLGTSDFPIHILGYELHRAARLNYILKKNEELGPLISVCHAYASEGANCGKCAKCMRTRMNLETYGHDQRILFMDSVDLVEYFRTRDVPGDEFNKRRDNVYIVDAIRVLPDGELRDTLITCSNNLIKHLEP